MKIAIIGAGKVGSLVAYTFFDRKLAKELLLVDVRKEYLEGIRLDLQSSFPFSKVLTEADINNYDIVVMTAGFPRDKESTREELFEKNKKVFDDVFKGKTFKKTAKIIVVTNPVVKLCDYLHQITGLKKENIIEFGNELDSARLKFLSQNKKAFVHGGHSENMKMSKGFEKYEKQVKEYAPKIISSCGGTVFGPAKNIVDVIEKILKK